MEITLLVHSILIFLLSALLEVGGGYLIWIWLKEGKSPYLALLGAICLVAYGIVATFQTQNFGRVYAAYGGVFVVFSILWAMSIDGFKPDKWDILGASLIMIGVFFIMFAPRT